MDRTWWKLPVAQTDDQTGKINAEILFLPKPQDMTQYWKYECTFGGT